MGTTENKIEEAKISGFKECKSQIKEDNYKEAKIPGAKESVPLDESEYKEKGSCICKISGKEGKIGTGFFCKMIYENKLVTVLITNYHVIDDKYVASKDNIKVYINEKYKIIKMNKNKIIYSSSDNEYDIIIMRLGEDEIKNYFEIDENIFNQNSELTYKDEPIYILHYPGKDEKAKVSYGNGIEQINEYDIKHLCNTVEASIYVFFFNITYTIFIIFLFLFFTNIIFRTIKIHFFTEIYHVFI